VTPAPDQSRVVAVSLVVLAAVAIAFALAYTRVVMVPFVLAIFISYLVMPLVEVLQERLRMPRVLSVLIALLTALGLLIFLALLITKSTRSLLASADIYQEEIRTLAAQLFSVLDRWHLELGQRSLLEGIDQLPILNMLRSAVGTVVDLVSTGALVVIFVIFLLLSRKPEGLNSGIYAEINSKIRKYLVTKFVISAATGVLVGSILALFGLDLALVFGVMAFLLNFIPSIGSVFATLLPIPIAILQFDNPWLIAAVILLPGVLQFLIGSALEPVIMGEGLGLHPVAVLLALIFWGLLWGVVGMLLAAPITAILRIVLERIETTRPAAELLAGRLPPTETPNTVLG
jgi:AI-2 transport protein TqsA